MLPLSRRNRGLVCATPFRKVWGWGWGLGYGMKVVLDESVGTKVALDENFWDEK